MIKYNFNIYKSYIQVMKTEINFTDEREEFNNFKKLI